VIIAQEFSKWKMKKVPEYRRIKAFTNIGQIVDNVDNSVEKSIVHLKYFCIRHKIKVQA